MAIRILRFIGGFGGDNIIRMALESDKSLQCNVEFEGLTSTGKIQDDKIRPENRLPDMAQIYDLDEEDIVDVPQLVEEIKELKKQGRHMILKSHLYISNFDDITVDILPTKKTLPWAVHRNYYKTLTPGTHSLPFNIPDPEVKKRFIIYQIAQNLTRIMKSPGTRKVIYIDDMFSSFKNFKAVCNEYGISINSHCEKLHKQWCEKNKSFLPSQAYLDMVDSDKFNYNDPDLSLSEKYSLMAIKGGFKIV